MRSPDEQQIAMICLQLAQGSIPAAAAMLEFVTGRTADKADRPRDQDVQSALARSNVR